MKLLCNVFENKNKSSLKKHSKYDKKNNNIRTLTLTRQTRNALKIITSFSSSSILHSFKLFIRINHTLAHKFKTPHVQVYLQHYELGWNIAHDLHMWVSLHNIPFFSGASS